MKDGGGTPATPVPCATCAALVEVLQSVRDALDDRADAEYIDGTPRGNWAMNLMVDVDAALAKAGVRQ